MTKDFKRKRKKRKQKGKKKKRKEKGEQKGKKGKKGNKQSPGGNLHHEYKSTVHNPLFIHYCIVHAWLASEINYYYY